MSAWRPWQVLRRAPIGLVVADRSRVRFVNPCAAEMVGSDTATALGPVLADVPWQDAGGRARLRGAVRLPDGGRRDVGLIGVRLGRRARAPWVFAVLDGTELPIVDPWHGALTDSLTGLPNRVLLMDELIAARERGPVGTRGALAFVDLDAFKALNERYGHQVGDGVLREMAGCLVRALPQGVVVSRLGGDEFGILFPGHTPTEAAAVLEQVAEACAAAPIQVAGTSLVVRFSAGVTGLGADTVDQVLAQADRALYHAKANDRGRCAVFGADSGFVRTRHELHQRIDHLAAEKSQLERVTLTDHLTGLPNTRALDQALDDLDRSHGQGSEYALLFIDLDRFGAYNHRHGDAAGDAALRRVAETLHDTCRREGMAFRKGGEEFVVVLPDCGRRDAFGVGERLRRAVEDLALPHGGHPDTPVVTITVAVAAATGGYGAHELVNHASKGAFATKENRRRNRVVPAVTPSPLT